MSVRMTLAEREGICCMMIFTPNIPISTKPRPPGNISNIAFPPNSTAPEIYVKINKDERVERRKLFLSIEGALPYT